MIWNDKQRKSIAGLLGIIGCLLLLIGCGEGTEETVTQADDEKTEEAAIVLTDSGKEFLRRMCYCVPEFDGATNADTEFWRDFMFYSFTGLLDESIEQIEVYREDIGYETQAKVSLQQMEEYAKLTFGVTLPDLKPKYEEMKRQTAFYFEDGYYYIGCSDFPDFDFTYKDCTIVEETDSKSIIVNYSISFEGDADYGMVSFTLLPADNENGFIICSKQWITKEVNNRENNVQIEPAAPTKEDVFAMREKVLGGMTDDEKERLTENIKVANLQMERAYLNDNIFKKLEDKDSLYWNYFDQKGDIQIGWTYDSNKKAVMNEEGITENEFYQKYGEPVIVYNRFDGVNFVELIQDMQKSVHDEKLYADLQQLIDLTNLATETHEMECANDIYKILHDMDYFLLRYGIEDVGKYTQDGGVVAKYYGVLKVYQNV